MDKESLRKEVSKILKSVAWMWEPKEKDYLPDSCDKDVDAIIQLLDTYSTQRDQETRLKTLKEVWNKSQPSLVPDGWEPDEFGKWLQRQLSTPKEKTPRTKGETK